jgi:sugar phosphate isomerase/epimerase
MTPLPPAAVEVAAFGLEFGQAVWQAAAVGFTSVVVEARSQRGAEDLDALADAGVLVTGGALGGGMSAGCALDAAAVKSRRLALKLLEDQVADAGRLGATWAHLAPGCDTTSAGDRRFAEAFGLLAQYASRRKVRLCLGHSVGSRFAGAAQALDWLHGQCVSEAGLALDVAACRYAGEDAVTVATAAGNLLGCVRLAAEALTAKEAAELATVLRRTTFTGGIVLSLDDPAATSVATLAAARALWDDVL